VFATGDRELFRKHGEIIGSNCRALGFNADFAPVLDLAFEASHSVMGSRAVSADPHEASSMRVVFWPDCGPRSVLGCGKHFPGLGEGKLDSHHELPVIEKTVEEPVGRGSPSLPHAAAATADGDDFARGVSHGHAGSNSGIAVEGVDH
jgi:beta-N-acetylhexosaminidase